MNRIGRNDPCPCRSGRKYKVCCGRLDTGKPVLPNGEEQSIPEKLRIALEHQQGGRLSQADALYGEILDTVPNHADALHLSGLVSHQRGDYTNAYGLISKAVQANPEQPVFFNSLGLVLQAFGRLDEGVASFRKALSIKPDFAEAAYNLGVSQQTSLQLEDAVASYRMALTIRPDYANASSNLGAALQALGQLDPAVTCYRQALSIQPDSAETLTNLGNVFHELHRLDEAVDCYHQAIAINPAYAAACNNLGNVLQAQDRLDEAVDCYRQALALKPDYAEACSNLGNVLQAQSQLDEAVDCYRQALALKPAYAEAHYNLGNVLQDQGRLDEAVASYRQALSIKPEYPHAHSNLLFCLNYHPRMAAEEVFREHLRWDEMQASRYSPRKLPAVDGNHQRRLRIGYVSRDLRQHSVSHFIEPLLREHDRNEVDIFCYSDVARPDSITQRLKALSDHWLDTVHMSDEALAQQIASDRIDILVDLAGHTAHNRLLVFSRKPAAVQISWLGYPHSTGLRAMDYRLVDAVTDPVDEASYASETLVRLENGFLCYQAPPEAPPPAAPPCMQNGRITFGSFNNPTKLASSTLDTWAALLACVPNSQLLLKDKLFADAGNRVTFLNRLARHGISGERITLLGFVPEQGEHLALYSRMDIALDPFPYNGTTTTCEALWMGVPVISLRGDRHAARVGASLLTQIGMTELIATSPKVYVEIATKLADDQRQLNRLRQELRPKLKSSSLCDAPAFALKIEEAYRAIWRASYARIQVSGAHWRPD